MTTAACNAGMARMFRKIALLADEAGDGDKGGGGGAPAGGSPEGGQGKPEDEKAKFEQRIRAALAEQKRTLTAEFDAKLAEATKAPPQKRHTRAELNAAVEAGTITREQADAEIDRQTREDARAEARQEAHEVVSAERSQAEIDSDIARYQAVAPEIMDDSHDTRQKIQAEYSYQLKKLKLPAGAATQLAAIRSVLGPIEKLERARSGRFQAEHHQETGGGSGGGQQKQKTGKLVDQLNVATKRHYEKQIENGLYKDWDAVEAELKFAKPSVRQRLGIA